MEGLDIDKIKHDKWSELGLENLGGKDGMNIRFMCIKSDKMEVYSGPFTLLKCILNDYWADIRMSSEETWDKEKIDIVMSKLYFCWVAMLQAEIDTNNQNNDQTSDQ